MVAVEMQGARASAYGEGDSDPTAQIFLQARWSGEAFAAADDLGKPACPPIGASPELASRSAILGDRDDGRNVGVVVQRQRRPNQAAKMGQQFAEKRPAAFHDRSSVGHGGTGAEPRAEALPDPQRQARPGSRTQQGSESQVVQEELIADRF